MVTCLVLSVNLKDRLKKHLQLQSASANQVDRRWLNEFMAAGFHSGLISLSDLKLEYLKAHRNAASSDESGVCYSKKFCHTI